MGGAMEVERTCVATVEIGPATRAEGEENDNVNYCVPMTWRGAIAATTGGAREGPYVAAAATIDIWGWTSMAVPPTASSSLLMVVPDDLEAIV